MRRQLLEHLRTVEATSVAPGHWRITVSGDVRSAVPELASVLGPRASRYLALHRKVRILRACLSRSMNIKLGGGRCGLINLADRAQRAVVVLCFANCLFGAWHLSGDHFIRFFLGSAFFARNIADVRPLFEWLPIVLIFLASAVSMRMWSEELCTLEYVLTLPYRPLNLLGKALACWLLIALALAFTLPLPFSISLIAEIDWGPIYAGYLAALLLAFAYLAIGLFVSASTDSQIVSLLVAVALCGILST